MNGEADGDLIFLVAGEPSGDRLGAGLMAALRSQSRRPLRFAGVGGPAMTEGGLVSLFPMSDLSVIGVAEVVPRIPLLLRRIRETAAAIRSQKPVAVVTIDSPDFSFRVMKRIVGVKALRVHYVAPSVWAWRRGRAKRIARLIDLLLALLPFEPAFFAPYKLACVHVGHPAAYPIDGADGAAFRRRHAIDPAAPLLAVLPGSRHGEIRRHLPIFGETVARLARAVPGLRIVVPTLAQLRPEIEAGLRHWAVAAVVVSDEGDKRDAFAASTAALAASGTVTVELARFGVPMVVAYRVSWLTGWLARRLMRVKWATLVNLVLDRGMVPEFLNDACRVENLAPATMRLLTDADERRRQTAAFGEALSLLGRGSDDPNRRAARAILGALGTMAKRGQLRS